ncbi:MAG: hypothetical protein ACI85Q_002576 [Salibacteraceae bacterium]|jgi:hypothetical protein
MSYKAICIQLAHYLSVIIKINMVYKEQGLSLPNAIKRLAMTWIFLMSGLLTLRHRLQLRWNIVPFTGSVRVWLEHNRGFRALGIILVGFFMFSFHQVKASFIGGELTSRWESGKLMVEAQFYFDSNDDRVDSLPIIIRDNSGINRVEMSLTRIEKSKVKLKYPLECNVTNEFYKISISGVIEEDLKLYFGLVVLAETPKVTTSLISMNGRPDLRFVLKSEVGSPTNNNGSLNSTPPFILCLSQEANSTCSITSQDTSATMVCTPAIISNLNFRNPHMPSEFEESTLLEGFSYLEPLGSGNFKFDHKMKSYKLNINKSGNYLVSDAVMESGRMTTTRVFVIQVSQF